MLPKGAKHMRNTREWLLSGQLSGTCCPAGGATAVDVGRRRASGAGRHPPLSHKLRLSPATAATAADAQDAAVGQAVLTMAAQRRPQQGRR